MPSDYARVEQAIAWIDRHAARQPGLANLARAIGLSPSHMQRLFTRWAGVSPKRFLELLTVNSAKEMLTRSHTVLDASYGAGLSGPGRLHDHMVTVDAVTPGEFKTGGEGLDITYGVHDSPFGPCLIALTERGICRVDFSPDTHADDEVRNLRAHWPQARFANSPSRTRSVADAMFEDKGNGGHTPVNLLLRGTNFQTQVWQALLRIPPGFVASYRDVAGWIGQPTAARAVGNAVGENAVAFLIPCHRVIRATGAVGDYRWGRSRKRAMLVWESARSQCGES